MYVKQTRFTNLQNSHQKILRLASPTPLVMVPNLLTTRVGVVGLGRED